MGIYSKDRTMLTIDPTAKSRPIPGYTSASDLYKIMEETLSSEFETYDSLVESEISMVRLDEAEAAKTDKRLKSFNKLCDSITNQLVNASAKTKSVCTAVNKKAKAFEDKGKIIDKYATKFDGNKDIMITSHFEIKYNKHALECTNKELIKFVKEAGNAGASLAKNAAAIAKANTEEINKNKHNVFKVAAVGKYADKFCCCCGEKKEIVSGNPFSGSVKPGNIVSEIKSAPKVNFDAATSAMDASFATIAKQITKIKADAAKANEIKAEDLAQLHALAAIAEGLIKAYIHMINDAFKCYSEHVKECIKVYIAASNIKAVKEGEAVVYRTTIASLMEADLFANDFDFLMENGEVDFEDEIEEESDTDEFYPEDNTIEEGCKKEACKEEAEETSEEPDSSDANVKPEDGNVAEGCKKEACKSENCVKESDEVDNDHSAPAKEEPDSSDANVAEGCKKEACKEEAEETSEEPDSSDANVKPEEQESPQECGTVNCSADPFEGMNEFEAAAQLSLMAETNWIIMLEELEDSEYDNYRQNILAKNMLEEQALAEADESGSMKERFIASMHKISEYIKNLFARLFASIANTLTKYKFLFSKESEEKQIIGSERLVEDKATFSGKVLKKSLEDFQKEVEAQCDKVTNRAADVTSTTAKVDLTGIIDSVKKDVAGDQFDKLVESYLDSLVDAPFTKERYDIARKAIDKYNDAKNEFKLLTGLNELFMKSIINDLKQNNAFEKQEDAGKKFKILHDMNNILTKIVSSAVAALSKDFTTSCRIVLMCYNAGKAAAKEDKKASNVEPAPANA